MTDNEKLNAGIDAELKAAIAEEEATDYEHVKGKDLREDNLDQGLQMKEEGADDIVTPNAPLNDNK